MLRQFGAELRRCRRSCGLSQDRLAELSGVSQSSISRLERGRAPYAGLHLIVRLSASMGIRMPLAFCPHEHACAWERLDGLGNPIRRPRAPDDVWWRRIESSFESELD
jgi:transcriptional regulator with XRE-family HTH domain